MGYLKDESVVKLLCDGLTSDPDWQVRDRAARSLALHKDASAIPSLAKALEDEHWQVRKFTARTLQEAADDSVIPALVKCLTDEYSDIRRDAAIALGNLHFAHQSSSNRIFLSQKVAPVETI